MTTQSFLAADPLAILHLPRCISIARVAMEKMPAKRAKAVLPLIHAAEEADYRWFSGPSYRVNEAVFDANVAAVNAAGVALLAAVGEEYT